MLLVVLEWLKYRAFHIRTVYIHSLDPGRGIPSFVMPLTWSVGLFWKVCASRINYLEISWFLHYPLNVWSHIFTGCSQGGKVTFGNTLSTFKSRVVLYNRPVARGGGVGEVVRPPPPVAHPKDFVPPFSNFVPPFSNFVPPFSNFVPPFSNFVPPFSNFVPPFSNFVPPFSNFVPPLEYVDDVTRTMSKGGGCAWCSTHPSSDPPPHLAGWLRACINIMYSWVEWKKSQNYRITSQKKQFGPHFIDPTMSSSVSAEACLVCMMSRSLSSFRRLTSRTRLEFSSSKTCIHRSYFILHQKCFHVPFTMCSMLTPTAMSIPTLMSVTIWMLQRHRSWFIPYKLFILGYKINVSLSVIWWWSNDVKNIGGPTYIMNI